MTTKRLSLLLILPLLAGLLSSCLGGEFARSIQLVNNERESRGLPVVLNNTTLQAKAQGWAENLAAQDVLVHSNLAEGAGIGWKALGENLAKAQSIDEAQQLLMASSPHRTTILSRRYNQIGVGVARSNGYYYVVQVFGG